VAAGCAAGVAAAAGDPEAEPFMAAANAVRLARADVSFALVSSSRPTAAFGLEAPDVPVAFGSAVAVAVAEAEALLADESASNSPKILSAAAVSLAQDADFLSALSAFLSPVAVAVAVALASPAGAFAAIFWRALTCFFRSAICDFALPVTALDEMLFNAASAFCSCS